MLRRSRALFGGLAAAVAVAAGSAVADETCQSPYLPRLTGQEDFVYVWTLGIEGAGDGSDKLVTVGANPARPGYGTVVSSVPAGRRSEAPPGAICDGRAQPSAGG